MDWFPYNNGLRHERLNNTMDRLHEKELRTVYSDFKANFHELLEKRWLFQYPLQKYSNFDYWNIQIFEWTISPIINEVVSGIMFQVKLSAPYFLRDTEVATGGVL